MGSRPRPRAAACGSARWPIAARGDARRALSRLPRRRLGTLHAGAALPAQPARASGVADHRRDAFAERPRRRRSRRARDPRAPDALRRHLLHEPRRTRGDAADPGGGVGDQRRRVRGTPGARAARHRRQPAVSGRRSHDRAAPPADSRGGGDAARARQNHAGAEDGSRAADQDLRAADPAARVAAGHPADRGRRRRSRSQAAGIADRRATVYARRSACTRTSCCG